MNYAYILIVKFFTSEFFSVFIWPILCSLVAGLVVYCIIETRENKRWKKSKNRLLAELNNVLIGSLTAVRSCAKIKPCYGTQSDKNYISYIKEKFGYNIDCIAVKEKLSMVNQEQWESFLSNFKNLQNQINFLLPLFISFPKADSRYIERIFDLNGKINEVIYYFIVFPEIYIESDNKNDVKDIRTQAISKVIEMINFVIKFQEELSCDCLKNENEK